MIIQAETWGDSLAVRIPDHLSRNLGLVEGSEIDIQPVSGALVLRPLAPARFEYSLEAMLDQVTPESLHEATDWGSPVGREHW